MKMFLGVLLGMMTWADAATVTLTPVADAEIRAATPTSNTGTSATVVSGGLGETVGGVVRRALLKFDVSSIPANATISSVALTTAVSKTPGDSIENSNFELRKVLQFWEETGVSWTFRSGLSAWQSGGVRGTNDSVAAPSSSVFISGIATYVFPSTEALVADVQGWVNNPNSNFGWLLRSDTEVEFTARHFDARESSNPPRLTVIYEEEVSEPTEPTIANIHVFGTDLQFEFQTEANFIYSVEFRNSLSEGRWEELTNFVAQASTTAVFTDPIGSGSSRFYRVSVSAQ